MKRLWIFAMLFALFVLLFACKGNKKPNDISSVTPSEDSSLEISCTESSGKDSSVELTSTSEVSTAQSAEESDSSSDSSSTVSDNSNVTSAPIVDDSSVVTPADSSLPQKDDSSVSSEDDSSVATPKDDSSVAPPKDDSSVAPPKDDSSVAPPKDDSSVAPPVSDSSEDSTVYEEGTVISFGGTHTLKGNIECPVIIDTTEDVTLVLSNATLKSTDSPAIYIVNANQTEIQLVGASTITDATSYSSLYIDTKGALFSEDSLVFSGSGSLTVTGNYKHAIACDDDIIIKGGNITVNSAITDGIHVNDEFRMNEGKLTVKSAGSDAIQSEQLVLINGGTMDISATGNGIKASNNLGLTCDISISGGTVKISSTNDALRSDNTISFSGGTTTINSENDGIQADDSVTVKGGKIIATCSNDGLKGKVITVSDGDISLTTADDGINASLGVKGTVGVEAGVSVNIKGGKLYINASGDGIDSKGTLTVSGGFIAMDGPDSGLDGMLAVNGTHLFNGGVFVACDSSDADTIELPASSSKQCVASINGQSFSAGSSVAVTDGSGKIIFCYTFKKSCKSLVFSVPELTLNNSYSVYSGVSIKGTATVAGMYYSSTASYSGGKLLKSFTQSSTVMLVN